MTGMENEETIESGPIDSTKDITQMRETCKSGADSADINGNNILHGEELVFKEKVEEITGLVIASKIAVMRGLFIAFVSGFTLFVGAGFIWKDNLLRPIIEYIYPVSYFYRNVVESSLSDQHAANKIYDHIKVSILNDDNFAKQLIDDDQKKEVISYIKQDSPSDIRLHHFPSVDTDVFTKIKHAIKNDEDMSKRIWSVLESGDRNEFNRLIKSKFGDALVDEFYEEMSFVYETLPTRNIEKFAREIEKKGAILLPVDIKTIGSKHENNQDTCGIRIAHAKYQAVVVIPEIATERMYRWLQCPSAEFPRVFVQIKINGLALDENVEVIGISRNGTGKNIVLRVTQQVAKKFNLPSWEKYESNASGFFKVVKASF